MGICPLLEPVQGFWVRNAGVGLDLQSREDLLYGHFDSAVSMLARVPMDMI